MIISQKNKTLLPCVFCLLFLLGCERPSGKWQALKDIPVFEQANDADQLKYTAKKGDVCALGREQIAKAFMYREIKCAQGKGWMGGEKDYPFQKIE